MDPNTEKRELAERTPFGAARFGRTHISWWIEHRKCGYNEDTSDIYHIYLQLRVFENIRTIETPG